MNPYKPCCLINRPLPLEHEPLKNYARRLRKANYYRDRYPVHDLLSIRTNIVLNNISIDDIALEKLSNLTQYDKTLLLSMTTAGILDKVCVGIGTNQIFPDDFIKKKVLISQSDRFCPDCLREYDAYFQTFLIKFSTICLEHKSLLLDKCPFCNTRIDMISESCFGCGKNFVEFPTKYLNNNESLIMVERMLSSALGIAKNSVHKPISQSDNPFLSLSQIEQLHLIICLTRLVHRIQQFQNQGTDSDWLYKRFLSEGSIYLETLHPLMNRVGRIIYEYPQGLHELLFEISDIEAQCNLSLLASTKVYKASLGNFFKKMFDKENYSKVWEAIHTFLKQNSPRHKNLLRTWKTCLNKFTSESDSLAYTAIGHCAKKLEISPVTIMRLIEDEKIEAISLKNDQRVNSCFVIDRNNFEKLELMLEKMSIKEMRDLLNIGPYKANRLIKSGVIQVDNNISKIPTVSKSAVSQFLDDYYYSIQERELKNDIKAINISKAVRSLSQYNENFENILQEIKAKNITAYREPGKLSLNNIWFEKIEFDAYRLGKYLSFNDDCSIDQSCIVLKCNKNTIKALLQMGVLENVSTGKNPRITVNNLMEFNKKYIRIRDAALILKTRPDRLRKMINNGRLSPDSFIIPVKNVAFFDKQILIEKFLKVDCLCGITYICSVLKCRQITVLSLIKQGHFTNLSEQIVDKKEWAFDVKQIEEFVGKHIHINDAASILGVRPRTIWNWIRKGFLPPECYIIAGKYVTFFNKDLLVEWSSKK